MEGRAIACQQGQYPPNRPIHSPTGAPQAASTDRLGTAIVATALLAPMGVLAYPVEAEASSLMERQAPAKPKPCVSVANVTEAEQEERHAKFADAFIYKKNITAAFEFIREDYIVRSHLHL